MRLQRSALLGAVLCVTTMGYAADLTKIERKILVEPKYNTASPRYCLLVFGPNADKRVWLVIDGRELHVDLNKNSILGEPGERIASSSSTYSRFEVTPIIESGTPNVSNMLKLYDYSSGVRLRFYGQQQQYVGFARATRPQFGSTAAEAPIIHFDGPMTLGRYSDKVTLRPNPTTKSYRKTSLRLMVGTPGLGTGTFAAYHCDCREERGDLVATFRYPTKKEDEKLLVEKVPLKTYG